MQPVIYSGIGAPVHGGRLHQAAEQFAIPMDHWIDLSTGINPHSYPLPAVPESVWQKLPDDGDNLLRIAAAYYGSAHLLALAGSQVAIEHLPTLRNTISQISRVGILSPAYAEYACQWKRQGHQVEALTADEIEARLPHLDVVVVIRPNNPTAEFLPKSRLNRWLKVLRKHNGWLIVDEAFIDAMPANKAISMITQDPLSNLIVLRSVGKFFGLAGIRLGFVWTQPALLEGLSAMLGTWSVSGIARWAGAISLQDYAWQSQMRQRLFAEGLRLTELITQCLTELLTQPLQQPAFVCLSTPLFCTVDLSESHKGLAADIYQQLARQGILIRYFEQHEALRVGLPANEIAWQRLESALIELKR
ncbi:threonine-phosphate decarboxylase CobD [Neptunomonas sp.]|uniref:threonine-phosphate decarboxylase CobD n=1 Tax=Neptunomonas sp. TaxID=1971898 RepID=UPI003565A37F